MYARSLHPCDIKEGEETPKMYIHHQSFFFIKKKRKEKSNLRLLVLSALFCRLRGASGDAVRIGEELLDIEVEKYGLGAT